VGAGVTDYPFHVDKVLVFGFPGTKVHVLFKPPDEIEEFDGGTWGGTVEYGATGVRREFEGTWRRLRIAPDWAYGVGERSDKKKKRKRKKERKPLKLSLWPVGEGAGA
jgi:hypothetical protein